MDDITESELQLLRNTALRYKDKNSLLSIAARYRLHHHLIPKMLRREEFRNQLNEPDKFKMTPFLCALQNGCDLSAFRAMIDSGADIFKTGFGQENAFHFAVMGRCCKEIIFELLQARPEFVHSKDYPRKTPLHYASEEWIVKTLIESGADPNVRDMHGKTPLHARLGGNTSYPSAVKYLINSMNPESLKFLDSDGNTLLHSLRFTPLHIFVTPLLKAGVDPALKNKKGDTPLHCFMKLTYNSLFIRQLLRGHPLLISIENNEGKCPLELAKDDHYKEPVKWVSLQDTDVIKNCISKITDLDLKEKISEFFQQCLSDIQKMKAYDVIPHFTLYDLVLKSYLNPDDTPKGLSWNLYGVALAFDDTLTVFGQEVNDVKARVRENIPTPILPKVENGIVSETDKASSSNPSQDLVNNAVTLAVSQDQVVGNKSVSERGKVSTSALSQETVIGLSAIQAVELEVEPTDPCLGEGGVKRKRTAVATVTVSSQTISDDEEYTRKKRLREEKEHEMSIKVLEMKLKVEEEKLKAEQEKVKAEQEKVKAEQEKVKAEQEKVKAEQEKLRYFQSLNNLTRNGMN